MGYDADVIVVGAGPSGGSAAYFLRQRGYRVLLLEKERLPRYKACAGGVPIRGLELFPFSFSPVVEQSIYHGTFAWGDKQVTQQVPQQCLVMVMRDRFDAFLLQQAAVPVEDRTRVTQVVPHDGWVEVRTDKARLLKSRFLLGADGPNSVVARYSGLKKASHMGVALEAEVQPPAEIMRHFRGRFLIGLGAAREGYCWVFPKSSHLSVGIGNMRKGKDQLKKRLFSSMERYGIPLDKAPVLAHPLPTYGGGKRLHRGNIAVLGDAAGLVDPLTGEGIRHAHLSGKLAAEAIDQGGLRHYSRRAWEEIGRDLLWARRLSSMFYARQHSSFSWLIRNERVFRDMMHIVSNRLSYKGALFKLPLYAVMAGKRKPLDRESLPAC